MKIILFVSVLTSAVGYARAQSSLGECTRPSGEIGLCLRYDLCPEMVEKLRSPDRNATELAMYKCGFDGSIPKVCCNYNCYTPDGNPGTCRHVDSCLHIKRMSNSKVREVRFYVRNSRCLSGPLDVCCGPAPAANFAEATLNCANQMSAFPPNENSMCCGLDAHSSSRIYGGNDTGLDQYPWLALLEYRKTDGSIASYCGGALISTRYVVTASHCINGPGAWPPLQVKLGEYNTSSHQDCVDDDCADPVITVAIEDILTHPSYEPDTSKNDIALIRLAKPVPYTDFIRPICLPASNVLRNTNNDLEVYVAGWGKINQTHTRSEVKQHVRIPLVPNKNCQQSFNTRMTAPPNISVNQICAGGEAGKDSCNGDSGGPLMLKTGLLHELIGVVSFGLKDCGTEGLPGIYTNVFKYSRWIRRNIRP